MNIINLKNTLGVVKATILHHLQHNGRTKVMDLEMIMSRGSLRAAICALVGQGYVARVKDNAFDGIAITNAGRVAIGIEVPNGTTQRPTRFCNASMTEPLRISVHTNMGRVGLARFGAAQRATANAEAVA
jgi:hypothetical protein